MKIVVALLSSFLLVCVVFSDDQIDTDPSLESFEPDLVALPSEQVRSATEDPAPPAPTKPTHATHWDTISVGSPEAWYPMLMDTTIAYYTNFVKNYIRMYQIVKERLLYQKQLLSQIPPFFDGINLYYDGDHLHSILSHNPELDAWSSPASPAGRNFNYTIARPKMAMEVIDTVRAIMGGFEHIKN